MQLHLILEIMPVLHLYHIASYLDQLSPYVNRLYSFIVNQLKPVQLFVLPLCFIIDIYISDWPAFDLTSI